MNIGSTCWRIIFTVVFIFSGVAVGQKNARNETFLINGNPDEIKVLRVQSREYVDIRDLARITKGSLSFEENRLILTLPTPPVSAPPANPSANPAASPAPEPGLSRAFMRAGIEATSSMREWRSTLAHLLRNGYPVGDQMVPYRERALDNLTLASAAASTPSDQSALQLVSNEFQNLSAWSSNVVSARNSASAAEYAISGDALANDPLFQRISQCGTFLGPMLASGSFEDNAVCH